MLPPSLVEEIRRLLAKEKLSYRKIARRTGVSRGLIGLIAAGKRPDYERLRQARKHDPLEPAGPPARCPTCGGRVYLPCRVCHARQAATRMPRRPFGRQESPDQLLQLQLKDEHRLRYEQVRARRQRAASRSPAAAALPAAPWTLSLDRCFSFATIRQPLVIGE